MEASARRLLSWRRTTTFVNFSLSSGIYLGQPHLHHGGRNGVIGKGWAAEPREAPLVESVIESYRLIWQKEGDSNRHRAR